MLEHIQVGEEQSAAELEAKMTQGLGKPPLRALWHALRGKSLW